MKLKGIELKGFFKIDFYDEAFRVYDEKHRVIYHENIYGDWSKREYDEHDNIIYLENSDGYIIDNRLKELTIKEIEKLLGYKIKIKGE